MDSTSAEVKDLRLILLGKTGSGKSATGNTILGKTVFTEEMSPSSVTQKCKKETVNLDDRAVSVIDTPGMFDTLITEKELKSEIENCFMLSLPGPHIFLLVISLATRFTEEEKNAIKWITENFGEESSKYTIVVFTRGNELKDTIENYLHKSVDLMKLIRDCKAGYVVFENTNKANRTQVNDLFELIDKTVQLNGGYYTSNIYKATQNKQWWRWVGRQVESAGDRLMWAAAGATAFPAAGAALLTEEAVVLSAPQMLALGSAAVMKGIGWFTRPKTDNS